MRRYLKIYSSERLIHPAQAKEDLKNGSSSIKIKQIENFQNVQGFDIWAGQDKDESVFVRM